MKEIIALGLAFTAGYWIKSCSEERKRLKEENNILRANQKESK